MLARMYVMCTRLETAFFFVYRCFLPKEREKRKEERRKKKEKKRKEKKRRDREREDISERHIEKMGLFSTYHYYLPTYIPILVPS